MWLQFSVWGTPERPVDVSLLSGSPRGKIAISAAVQIEHTYVRNVNKPILWVSLRRTRRRRPHIFLIFKRYIEMSSILLRSWTLFQRGRQNILALLNFCCAFLYNPGKKTRRKCVCVCACVFVCVEERGKAFPLENSGCKHFLLVVSSLIDTGSLSLPSLSPVPTNLLTLTQTLTPLTSSLKLNVNSQTGIWRWDNRPKLKMSSLC